MTSCVASPTRPSSASPKRELGASSRVLVGKTAPGRSNTWARIASKSGRRSVMTGTNWPSGAAVTSAVISSAETPVAAARPAASAGRSVTWALSTPTLTTSVSVNSGAPVASVIGARSASDRLSTRCCPSPSSGCTRVGAETTCESSVKATDSESRAHVHFVASPTCRLP